jgi:hypothetical protein
MLRNAPIIAGVAAAVPMARRTHAAAMTVADRIGFSPSPPRRDRLSSGAQASVVRVCDRAPLGRRSGATPVALYLFCT